VSQWGVVSSSIRSPDCQLSRAGESGDSGCCLAGLGEGGVLRHLEDVIVKAGGTALRYGRVYGPGAIDDQVELVRKRQFPLAGGGKELA
jgi:hypothetical protein